MYKVNIKKSTLVFSTIAILFMITISSIPMMNSSALDLGIISKDNNFGSIDTSSLFNCVGAAITCDNDNTVNNNVTSVTNPPPPPTPEAGTLSVIKEIRCDSTGGTPSNFEVCEYAKSLDAYPTENQFEFTITGNNPNPPQFFGSSTGTAVTLDAGAYEISETSNLGPTQIGSIALALGASGAGIGPTFTIGDCGYTGNIGFDEPIATGTMTADGSQECTIINTLFINGGSVPTGAPEI